MKSLKSPDWQRVWRGAGIQFLVLFVIAGIFRGMQPEIGASAATLVDYYDGNSTRIFIATVILGFAFLNLMWFGAAIASALRDAGKAGWGAAATASSTAFASVWFILIAIGAALAYSIAGSGNDALTSGLNELIWVLLVLSAFPTAMLIMSGSFGLWRAGLLSNRGFGLGVTAMVLVLLRATTWASDGFWAPDGVYSQYIATGAMALWILGISRVLLAQRDSTTTVTDAPVPAH